MNGLKNKVLLSGLGLWLAISGLQAQPASFTGEMPASRCGAVQYEQRLQQRNPQRLQQRQTLDRLIQEALTEKAGAARASRVGEVAYRIPVVVHVIHNNASGALGGSNNPNISDEQILSQIRVLNEDYRRVLNTRGYNTSPIGADTGIEFFLARTDPNGSPTSGITRHLYTQKREFDVYNDDLLLSEIAYWPSDRYLNIWVAPLEGSFLGYGHFPTAASIKGLEEETDERTDGVIIDYRVFGTGTGTVTSNYYAYGRTTTHEVGHWLGLIHTWGDVVCGDDYCDDTPPTERAFESLPCREVYSNCNGVRTRNLIENYMDYSPDVCMNMFTGDQRERMRMVLEVSPRRRKLVLAQEALPETETLTVALGPNPTSAALPTTLTVQFAGYQTFTVSIVDVAGRLVREQEFKEYPGLKLTLPLHSMGPGVYFVKVRTAGESATRRLLVY
ncbi:M43 family zinc metalloprotease [Tellurirhabdus rosea]|uniref:M43 family zinc metalloprotease n=1 Tax=Tellurirhabdus rosea TaxID=2674997 RepID=UPI002250BABC|nr:M43 family zinc metalloprotease [Tellurirhabdus rosea]